MEEAVEGLAAQQTILQQGKVDELVDDGVVLGVVGDEGLLLVFLLLELFLCLADGFVDGFLLLVGGLFLLLAQGGEACVETLYLG